MVVWVADLGGVVELSQLGLSHIRGWLGKDWIPWRFLSIDTNL